MAREEALSRRAEDWLQRVGLRGFGDRYPHQLSGGMRKRVALAQTLILDPQIILMDEPFSALDIQTRQLMENELLELWSADRKSVVFITHDLEEAISLSDRVVVLSAGPESHPIGEFEIDLPRPRDVAEIRLTPRFIELHTEIWHAMKEEVLKGYAQQKQSVGRCASGSCCCWPALFAGLARRPRTRRCCRRSISTTRNKAAFFFGEPLEVLGADLGLVLLAARSTRTCG